MAAHVVGAPEQRGQQAPISRRDRNTAEVRAFTTQEVLLSAAGSRQPVHRGPTGKRRATTGRANCRHQRWLPSCSACCSTQGGHALPAGGRRPCSRHIRNRQLNLPGEPALRIRLHPRLPPHTGGPPTASRPTRGRPPTPAPACCSHMVRLIHQVRRARARWTVSLTALPPRRGDRAGREDGSPSPSCSPASPDGERASSHRTQSTPRAPGVARADGFGADAVCTARRRRTMLSRHSRSPAGSGSGSRSHCRDAPVMGRNKPTAATPRGAHRVTALRRLGGSERITVLVTHPLAMSTNQW